MIIASIVPTVCFRKRSPIRSRLSASTRACPIRTSNNSGLRWRFAAALVEHGGNQRGWDAGRGEERCGARLGRVPKIVHAVKSVELNEPGLNEISYRHGE